jgi:hypothetical protein
MVLLLAVRPWSGPVLGQGNQHQVYVALGFHVNLYHSYRADRNDEGGFGKDIRIIRRIIQALDQANARGVPVRAVWDFDNLFSLERLLPQYAPDIIIDIKRRVGAGGDEVILMSYNNALGSALNQEEFEVSVRQAVTNSRGSGVLDLFGGFSPIVRPQEMMIGPGCYGKYRDLGLEAVVLYHSAITFDAFRVFADPLTRAEAFNPLTYRNEETKEEMTVIPAYNIGDLLENGSLAAMAEDLHQDQVKGKIDRDVLILVNFDADDEFWTGYDLPWHLSWLPNTGGLEGLVEEVAGLDYVRFTTLAGYLENHPPVGKVEFGQDLADGNFNGYNSWAEKSLTSEIWTAVEADRRVHGLAAQAWRRAGMAAPPRELAAALESSFQRRLELLSTTNFGMSAPDVAPARRRVVESTVAEMKAVDQAAGEHLTGMIRGLIRAGGEPVVPEGMRWLDSVYLLEGGGSSGETGFFLTFDVSNRLVHPEEEFYISDSDGRIYRPIRVEASQGSVGMVENIKLYFPAGASPGAGRYQLLAGPPEVPADRGPGLAQADEKQMANEFIRVEFNRHGLVEGVFFKERRVLEQNGLGPLISYRDGDGMKDHRPRRMKIEILEDGSQGAAVVRLTASLALPEVPLERQGRVIYHLTLLPGVPYLFVEVSVDYPQTNPDTLLTGGHPSLTGYVDRDWMQVAPAELKPTLTADKRRPFRVHRKNYLGTESSYGLDYFKHSPKNLDLADVNNHITAEYVAVTGLEGGVAVAADTRVLDNFAFCPMKVEYQPQGELFKVRLNPFGSYFGPQYAQPSWGNGLGYTTALAAGGQYHSSAPSYNAVSQSFSMMLAFFDGADPSEGLKKDLCAFAHPPEAVTGGRIGTSVLDRRPKKRVTAPLRLAAASDDHQVFFHWSKAAGPVESYKLYCGSISGNYDRVWSTSHVSLETHRLEKGQRYYAAVAPVDSEGREGPISGEIEFIPGDWPQTQAVDLPMFLQLRLMTAGLAGLVR